MTVDFTSGKANVNLRMHDYLFLAKAKIFGFRYVYKQYCTDIANKEKKRQDFRPHIVELGSWPFWPGLSWLFLFYSSLT